MLNARTVSLLALLAVLSVGVTGCVPYEKYRLTVAELERAKGHNADLIAKYNQLLTRAADSGAIEAMDPAERDQLMAQIASLRSQLDQARSQPAAEPAFRESEMPEETRSEKGGIALGEALLFSPGSADLKRAALPTLDQIVDLLQASYGREIVMIEGHTDNTPLRSTAKLWKDNMNLAYHRARAVFEYFKAKGIPEDRMIVHAYSFNKPLNPGDATSSVARRANRRVVVRRSGQTVIGQTTAMR